VGPEAPQRVLVVDDEESVRFFLTRGLRKAGYAVDEAADGAVAVASLSSIPYDVVLTDLVMPGVSGLDVLAAVHELDRDSIVILMTAHGTVENAIDALRKGAFDYLTKPFDLKELLVTIERALERRAVERENRKLRFLVENRTLPPPVTGSGLAGARRQFEREFLAEVLRKTRGNVTKAAALAKISRPNLHKKLRVLGLRPSDFKR
jgi:DNA-binding NtrC family response regulator